MAWIGLKEQTLRVPVMTYTGRQLHGLMTLDNNNRGPWGRFHVREFSTFKRSTGTRWGFR